jgi:hypothetical protein
MDIPFSPQADYTKLDPDLSPSKDIQPLLRDANIIEILMNIVYFAFKNRFYGIQGIERNLYIADIFQMCFIAIRIGIAEYKPNELYASQWLDNIIEIAFEDTENVLDAKATLTELIDNNPTILNLQIKEAIIDKFVDIMLKDKKGSQYTSIIRATLVCDEAPILTNQTLVANRLLENRARLRSLLCDIAEGANQQVVLTVQREGGPVEINISELQFVTIEDSEDFYEYYVDLIQLMSELCLGRNYKSINLMREQVSLSLILKVVEQKDLSPSLRTAFFKLLQSLYIDVAPHFDLKLPNYVKSLSSSETQDTMRQMSEKAEGEDNKLHYKKIVDTLMNILSENYTEATLEDNKDLLIAALKILRQMLSFGFFKSHTEYRFIFTNLITLLSLVTAGRINLRNISRSRTFLEGDFAGVNQPEEKSSMSSEYSYMRNTIMEIMKDLLRVQQDQDLTNIIRSIYPHPERKSEQEVSERNYLKQEPNVLLNLTPKAIQISINSTLFESERIFKISDQIIQLLFRSFSETELAVKENSLEILNSLFSTTSDIQHAMTKVLVLEDSEEKKLSREANELSKMIMRLEEKFINWFNSQEVQEELKMMSLLSKVQKLTTRQSEMNLLAPEKPELTGVLADFKDRYMFIYFALNKDHLEPHKVNSTLLELWGGVQSLVNILDSVLASIKNNPSLLISKQQLIQNIIKTLCYCSRGCQQARDLLTPSISKWIGFTKKQGQNGLFRASSSKTAFVTSFRTDLRPNNSANSLHDVDRDLEEENYPVLGNLVVLIESVVGGNSKMLQNCRESEELIVSILKAISSQNPQEISFYQTASWLECLMKCMVLDGSPLPLNQSAVMKHLVSNSKEGVFAGYKNNRIVAGLIKNFRQKSKECILNNRTVIALHPRMCLDVAFIRLLTFSCLNRNKYTELICRSIIGKK